MRTIWYGVLSIGCVAGAIFTGCGDQPEAPTGSTSSGSSGGTTGTGGAGGCQAATDCPASTVECKVPSCTVGVCGVTDLVVGAAATMQTAGDCKKRLCDGMGGVTVATDDTDVPDDKNVCTADTCTGGVAANTAVAPTASGQCMVSGAKGVCGDPAGGAKGTCVECNVAADCASNVCGTNNKCLAAACGDTVKNGTETDVDCGGSCSPCPIGKACLAPADCQSKACSGNVCQPSCTDGIQNQGEADVDCAGPCAKCGPSKKCGTGADCAGGLCDATAHTCTPTCTDGAKNNAETDVDCGGGTCGACGLGKACAQPSDCASTLCTSNKCSQLNGCDPVTALDKTGQANVAIAFGGALGDSYSPSCIKVSVGTKVTFNGDFSSHPFQGGDVDAVPPAATTGPFAAGVSSGMTATFTMSSAGSFGFYCQFHEPSMAGTVFVQ
jgi:plastocyanin